MESITLDCKKCGAPLKITADMEIFTCGHCGMSMLVKRSGSRVSLVKIEDRVRVLEIDLIKRQIKEVMAVIDEINNRDGLWSTMVYSTFQKAIDQTKTYQHLLQKLQMFGENNLREYERDYSKFIDPIDPIQVQKMIVEAFPEVKVKFMLTWFRGYWPMEVQAGFWSKVIPTNTEIAVRKDYVLIKKNNTRSFIRTLLLICTGIGIFLLPAWLIIYIVQVFKRKSLINKIDELLSSKYKVITPYTDKKIRKAFEQNLK